MVNRQRMEERINECGPRTADSVGQAFRPVRGEGDRQRMGERINECGPQTADGVGQAFEAVRGEGEPSTNGERINEFRLQTADDLGQVFQPVRGEGEPSTNGGTNQRMRTADGRRRRTGFRGCQRGGGTVNEWGNESTNVDRGRQTA